ncbi:MAG: septum formation initiator family protein [Candidatus Dependentiae bacterium]|nr:septum formation initiator family protein [Candidatus Dependentiae bacterium]
MTFLVRRFIIMFLIFEVALFVLLYCFGPKGLSSFVDLKNKKQQTIQDIQNLKEEIEKLRLDVQAGLSDFSKEKIAREKLLMKKDQELVYFKTK